MDLFLLVDRALNFEIMSGVMGLEKERLALNFPTDL